MANNILIVNTIKHLRLKQIYYQLYYRLFSHKLMEYNVPRQSSLRMVSVIAKWYCYNVPKTFTFLNLIGDFKSWNDVSHGMLWAYNLNYMDWLLQPDMTFEQGSEWVERFITDLPTNRIGLDPYLSHCEASTGSSLSAGIIKKWRAIGCNGGTIPFMRNVNCSNGNWNTNCLATIF